MDKVHKRPDDRPLAYRDQAFLDTEDARPLRILSEYLAPLRAFRRARVHDTVVFFGSARLHEDGPLGRYYEEARRLSRLITEWALKMPADHHRLIVCTGGGRWHHGGGQSWGHGSGGPHHRPQHRPAARAAA